MESILYGGGPIYYYPKWSLLGGCSASLSDATFLFCSLLCIEHLLLLHGDVTAFGVLSDLLILECLLHQSAFALLASQPASEKVNRVGHNLTKLCPIAERRVQNEGY